MFGGFSAILFVASDVWNSVSKTFLSVTLLIWEYLILSYIVISKILITSSDAHESPWEIRRGKIVGMFIPEHWVRPQMLEICRHRES